MTIKEMEEAMNIKEKLEDLQKQATSERSHYYVGSVVREAIDTIARMQYELDTIHESKPLTVEQITELIIQQTVMIFISKDHGQLNCVRIDDAVKSIHVALPNQDAKDRRIAELESQLLGHENTEASLCPEGVGFDEVITWQRTKIAELENQLDISNQAMRNSEFLREQNDYKLYQLTTANKAMREALKRNHSHYHYSDMFIEHNHLTKKSECLDCQLIDQYPEVK